MIQNKSDFDIMSKLELTLNFTFQELQTLEGLARLDQAFLEYLNDHDNGLFDQLMAYRNHELQKPHEVSVLLLACSPYLEKFVIELFGIQASVQQAREKITADNLIFEFKKYFVLREAKRAMNLLDDQINFSDLDRWLNEQLQKFNLTIDDRELAIARLGLKFLDQPLQYQDEIQRLIEWCCLAMKTDEGKTAVNRWIMFKLPNKLNYENLVEVEPVNDDTLGRLQGPIAKRRHRDGFQLTDPRMDLRAVMNEIHYCVYCHKNEGDFCSTGFPVKKGDPSQGLKMNPLGEVLTGCPLEEKISEMHVLKKEGYGIASLAMILVDNPMCPVTGHRICNDCMKGCIYQKQDPVNIPQTETRILTDVLDLPWGVEIYDLLTRWNPLRKTQWLPKPYNGLKVLVMGMGPAGFTLAHYLLMEGFAVVGCEGLKIEPLPEELITQPIYSFADIKESLDSRIMTGFGGVAEYGITVRWDKNFLKLIYISLMRRPYFQVFGGVRFGGTLQVEDAWRLGFDHLALAVGAGLPRELHIPNSLASGMRQANDFLMALQLTGAAKFNSLANLQMRLPAVVIGGGLTAVDTATEAQVYYIAQVEKTLDRYEKLSAYYDEAKVRMYFDDHTLKILDEFLAHGREIRHERQQAELKQRLPDLNRLVRAWGGVTIAYRRTIQESPAYRRNHEEVMNALEEGIYYAQGLEPKAVIVDEFNDVAGLSCLWHVMDESGNWLATDEEQLLPARSIFVATGAKPNIAYEFEHRGTFQRQGFNYQRFEWLENQLTSTEEPGHVKMLHFGPFTSYEQGHRRVTFLGDTHPIFHGSVVKAIASAKRTYPNIVDILEKQKTSGDDQEYQAFHDKINALFQARVVAVKRCHPKWIELIVHAPMATRNFEPGQFYRIQNFESHAVTVDHTKLQTEALAAVGIYREEYPDCLSFLIEERGVSARLFATLKAGDPIALMGPTGARLKLPTEAQTILIIGSGLAIVHLLTLSSTLRQMGHRILFVGCFNHKEDIFLKQEVEQSCDAFLWVTEQEEWTSPLKTFLQSNSEVVRHVITIGSSQLIRAMSQARIGVLQECFSADTSFQVSVHGSMQCMLKGVCAQCLQWQIDPSTGKRTKAVYACSWQNQPMEIVDVDNLDERLGQNRVLETLSNIWLDYLFEHSAVEKF